MFVGMSKKFHVPLKLCTTYFFFGGVGGGGRSYGVKYGTFIIIIKQTLAQFKQIIVTNALCYQSPERNITVFKRCRNTVNDSELSAIKADGSAFQAAGQA
jgi:hypothetical protein